MKSLIGSLIVLVLSVSVGAEPLLEGRVRLSSGQPAAGVQVRLFDLTDLRQSIDATTDAAGFFALSLQTFSTERSTALPTDFALGQNYPNPFNPSTIIPYQLPASDHVRLDVFNVLGQRLATLVDAERSAGMHTAQWDGTDASGRAVGAGVYIYRLSSGRMMESRRMVLVDGQAGVPAVALGPVQSAVEEIAATDLPVYGLTISGEGLVAYVDPSFRVGNDEADIVLEEHGGSPRMKLTTGRILGDVNNDGQVDVSDVLYIALYSRNPSIILPNNGDISLGDVNGDGRVDVADASLLVQYITDPSDPALPPGIGQAVSVTSVNLDIALSHIYWTDSRRGTIHRANLDGSNVEILVTGAYAPNRLALDVDGGHIYWTDWELGTIHRANLDGSNAERLRVLRGGTSGLALDVDGGHIYWTDWERGTIRRANLDGSNAETLPINVDTPTPHHPRDLALDVDGGHIYWMASFTIHRANLDGSNVETLISWADSPRGLALDVARGQMYWMEWDTSGTFWEGIIRRANLDGSNVETLPIDVDTPSDLVLDVAKSQMYWTGMGIHRANLDGSDIETLATEMTTPLRPGELGLDVNRGQMYWTDMELGTIHRANLDGSNIETLITGVGSPYHLALDTARGQMYWTSLDWDNTETIRRANLDGSNVETLPIEMGSPRDLVLDGTRGHIYWAGARSEIYRANLDGSNVETLPIEMGTSRDLALDAARGHIYWTKKTRDDRRTKIITRRANLDGSNVETLPVEVSCPGGVCPSTSALDVAGGHIYWADPWNGIRRANLDGSNVETLPVEMGSAGNLALDVVRGHIYWADPWNGIRRANLDGSNTEALIGSRLPHGIALGP